MVGEGGVWNKTNKIETSSSHNPLSSSTKIQRCFKVNKSEKLKMELEHSCWSSLRVHSNVLILVFVPGYCRSQTWRSTTLRRSMATSMPTKDLLKVDCLSGLR